MNYWTAVTNMYYSATAGSGHRKSVPSCAHCGPSGERSVRSVGVLSERSGSGYGSRSVARSGESACTGSTG